MKKISTILALCLLSAVVEANRCVWPKLRPIEKGSLVSTYTFHYWDYVKNNQTSLPAELLEKGAVVGDFQFNNINIYYNLQKKAADLAISDLDDAGQGLLIADYIKFIAYLNEKYGEIKDKIVLQHYLNGLKKKNFDVSAVPEKIKAILDERIKYFELTDQLYADRKVTKKANKFEKKQDLSPLDSLVKAHKEAIKQARSLIVSEKYLDGGYKENLSGSSINLIRVLLLTSVNDKYKIHELKETRCSALEAYQPQTSGFNYALEFKSENYWKNSHYITAGDTKYLFRLKRQNHIETLDLQDLKASEIMPYINYFAHYLGSLHSKNVSSKYIDYIENNLEQTAKIIKNSAHVYLVKLTNDVE
jgi:hypothetical protein